MGLVGAGGAVAAPDVTAISDTGASANPLDSAGVATDTQTDAATQDLSGLQIDQATSVSIRYADGLATFTIVGPAVSTYDVELETTGGAALGSGPSSITVDSSGQTTFDVPLVLDSSRRGGLTATLTRRSGTTPLQNSWSLWLESTKDGGLAQGTSQIEAQLKAIDEDYATDEARQEAFEALGHVDAVETVETLQPQMSRMAAAATTSATVSGTAKYTDWNLDARPARHITVALEDAFSGDQLATTTTDDYGNFSFTLRLYEPTDVLVTFRPLSAVASVQTPLSQGYVVTTGTYTLNPGTALDLDVPLGGPGAFGNAFVIHDALWTAHLFAVLSGHGDEPIVEVTYPSVISGDYAGKTATGIDFGANQWSAWDTIVHEYGHWYDDSNGLGTRGGGDHCARGNLASVNCGFEIFGKDHGGRLAWAEGFANYYSAAASKLADHPYIATVGDGIYQDTLYTLSGESLGTSITAASDNSAPSAFHGEDNEFAIAGVLYNAVTQGSSRISPAQLSTLIEDSDGLRLSDFVAYVWPSDGSSRTSRAAEAAFNCQLSLARIAPYNLAPVSADLSEPPVLTWAAGNTAESGILYSNNSFKVEAVDAVTLQPYFTSPAVSGTSWTPTGRQWEQIAAGHTEVHLRVVGTSIPLSPSTEPRTGPYRGCANMITGGTVTSHGIPVNSGALVNDAGCTASTLAANDDGSTGAVDLPFPVNFSGTTYTYLFVNNNGNVTFNARMGTYTPFTINANTPPIIAPFFADIDTGAAGSANVTYGTTHVNGRQAFCVNWINVGHFSQNASHLVSAQLLLIDRSDVGAGDVDIVFNYGHIGWETGDASGGSNGFGGTPVGIGFSAGTGDVNAFYEMPGSRQTRQFIDGGPRALVSGSYGALATPGRYVFPVRNGAAGNSATGVRGSVTSGGAVVGGAPVQVCPHAGGPCVFQTRTTLNGTYDAVGIPAGTYDVTVYPPNGSSSRRVTASSVEVAQGEVVVVDVELQTITGMPSGTTFGPLVGSGTEPMVNWHSALTIGMSGCAGGTGSFEVLSTENGPVYATIASGQMVGDSAGHFSATFGPVYPLHGPARVVTTIVCPDGSVQTAEFDMYIDPSGRVVDQSGTPVAGATVTLLRSDTPEGEFTPVEDGSDLMSPANRANPMTTDDTGAYGWDVVAGYYKLVATKDGCTSATTGVFPVPPPVLDLDVVLECVLSDVNPPAITVTDQNLEGNTLGGWHGDLAGVEVSDSDTPADQVSLTSDAPDVLPLGASTVRWTATDSAGNTSTAEQTVTVVDTTIPAITCPAGQDPPYTHAPVLGDPEVADLVDSRPVVTDDRPGVWPVGASTVTWTATDASGNRATCTQTVTLTLPTDLADGTRLDTLIATSWAAPGDTLTLDAALHEPAGAHAGAVARAYAIVSGGAIIDLGDVTFDSAEGATVALPADFPVAGDVRIVVLFDATPPVWDIVQAGPVVPSWDATTVYLVGDTVSYGGRRFVAQWTTQNQTPGATPVGPWAEIGLTTACQSGPVQQWTDSWIYTGGETVVHDGSVWTAKWWTRNQEPGASQWGPWATVGSC
jgi:chitodextrinase